MWNGQHDFSKDCTGSRVFKSDTAVHLYMSRCQPKYLKYYLSPRRKSLCSRHCEGTKELVVFRVE